MANRVHQVLNQEQWATAEADQEFGPGLLRFRTPIICPTQGDDVGDYSHRLSVLWAYALEGTGAMPDTVQSNAMAVFERRLMKAWESDRLAYLAVVLTFDGARDWVFYTSDIDECMKRLHEMPQAAAAYPIELSAGHEPGWEMYHEILEPVPWRGEQHGWEAELRDGTKLMAVDGDSTEE